METTENVVADNIQEPIETPFEIQNADIVHSSNESLIHLMDDKYLTENILPESVAYEVKPEYQPPIIDDSLNGNVEYISEYEIREKQVYESHSKYLSEHPEVRAFLADYLQLLLHRKPENVYEFTVDYFK
ncbi:hypothetical protein BC833DRAFT_616474 [Globomyces pollinis-pini]|nr:hypothetical protein BC833DRAFT_616474 [Globomyces pollinis-pini]